MPNYFLKHWFNVFYIAFQRAGSSLIYNDIAFNDCHRLKKKILTKEQFVQYSLR